MRDSLGFPFPDQESHLRYARVICRFLDLWDLIALALVSNEADLSIFMRTFLISVFLASVSSRAKDLSRLNGLSPFFARD